MTICIQRRRVGHRPYSYAWECWLEDRPEKRFGSYYQAAALGMLLMYYQHYRVKGMPTIQRLFPLDIADGEGGG